MEMWAVEALSGLNGNLGREVGKRGTVGEKIKHLERIYGMLQKRSDGGKGGRGDKDVTVCTRDIRTRRRVHTSSIHPFPSPVRNPGAPVLPVHLQIGRTGLKNWDLRVVSLQGGPH